MKTFRLPDGETTTDEDKYVSAWKELGGIVNQALYDGEASLTACDPGFKFIAKTGCIDLTTDVAFRIKRLVDRIEELKNADLSK